MNIEQTCFERSSAGDPAYLRQFQLPLGGKTYLIRVATAGYLQGLRARNTRRPPSARVDENIYVFEGVLSAEELGGMSEGEICQRLHQAPFEQLKPFLVAQTFDSVDGEGFEPPASSM